MIALPPPPNCGGASQVYNISSFRRLAWQGLLGKRDIISETGKEFSEK